jgi:hypothetical protein
MAATLYRATGTAAEMQLVLIPNDIELARWRMISNHHID